MPRPYHKALSMVALVCQVSNRLSRSRIKKRGRCMIYSESGGCISLRPLLGSYCTAADAGGT